MNLVGRVKEYLPLRGALTMLDLEQPYGTSMRCPLPERHAHGDRSRSAGVFRGQDGTERWRCHACGAGGDVIDLAAGVWGLSLGQTIVELGRRLGLVSAAPLLTPRPQVIRSDPQSQVDITQQYEPSGKIIATYPYHDERGTLLYEVCRFEPKSFRPRRPDGKGGWLWGAGDARRVIYRFPTVRYAISRRRQVYITEGEKDADVLNLRGYVATTNAFGASGWRDEFFSEFAGADVVVCCDHDAPGLIRGERLRAGLAPVVCALAVRVPTIGKDVAEMFNLGGDLGNMCDILEEEKGGSNEPIGNPARSAHRARVAR